MQKLVHGIHQFQESIFRSQQQLFERLATGQHPDTLFITCSDSRINPNLLTQTKPGELFLLRNAGNIVPPYDSGNNGEAATIEFAVVGLGVQDIIICGHSHCGAMKGLLNIELLLELPAMAKWLGHAEQTWRKIADRYRDLDHESLISVATEENVLVQLENLRTHPSVASRLAEGKLKVHGWVYVIETGAVFAYDPAQGQFVSVLEANCAPLNPRQTMLDFAM